LPATFIVGVIVSIGLSSTKKRTSVTISFSTSPGLPGTSRK
jgi:hypothetical protein